MRYVRGRACVWCNHCALRNQQGPGSTGTLGIVFKSQIAMDMSLVGAVTSERCEYDAMSYREFAHICRLKELGGTGGRHER